MTDEQKKAEEKLKKAAEKYAEKEASKKLDPKEWNDYMLQHSFTGIDLYEAFIAGAKWNEEVSNRWIARFKQLMASDTVIPVQPMTEPEFHDFNYDKIEKVKINQNG